MKNFVLGYLAGAILTVGFLVFLDKRIRAKQDELIKSVGLVP